MVDRSLFWGGFFFLEEYISASPDLRDNFPAVELFSVFKNHAVIFYGCFYGSRAVIGRHVPLWDAEMKPFFTSPL